jgi:hypothetical protein
MARVQDATVAPFCTVTFFGSASLGTRVAEGGMAGSVSLSRNSL